MIIKAVVILSERSESKDPGTDSAANVVESAQIPRLHFIPPGMTSLRDNRKGQIPIYRSLTTKTALPKQGSFVFVKP